MDLIRGFQNIIDQQKGCIATIGNFDGVHLGHQKVLKDLVANAQETNLRSTVVLFEPQPAEYFSAKARQSRLTDLREKVKVFEQCGVDQVFCLRFCRRLAEWEASDFIDTLVKRLDIKHLVVGHDFCFGKDRKGDVHLLEARSSVLGYSLDVIKPHLEEQVRVSSTLIRQKLACGDLDAAAALLGRPYSISGLVLHGDKRGRTIGFPTANLRPKHQNCCLHGVYAVTLHGYADKPLRGVANLGTRPTVSGERLQLEVHVLDFNADLYQKHLSVNLLHLIREERKFDSLAQLKEQIHRDELSARAYFESETTQKS